MSDLITSPVGEIQFLALSRPVKTFDGDSEVYKIRCKFDGTTAEGMAFRAAVEAVNAKKIVTTEKNAEGRIVDLPEGFFIVNAQSKYVPTVLDANGTELTEDAIPYFDSRTDTGTAKFQAKVDTRGKQGTIHLTGVVLQDLTLAEREETETTNYADALRASLGTNTNGA